LQRRGGFGARGLVGLDGAHYLMLRNLDSERSQVTTTNAQRMHVHAYTARTHRLLGHTSRTKSSPPSPKFSARCRYGRIRSCMAKTKRMARSSAKVRFSSSSKYNEYLRRCLT
jgi:hypothetical protein